MQKGCCQWEKAFWNKRRVRGQSHSLERDSAYKFRERWIPVAFPPPAVTERMLSWEELKSAATGPIRAINLTTIATPEVTPCDSLCSFSSKLRTVHNQYAIRKLLKARAFSRDRRLYISKARSLTTQDSILGRQQGADPPSCLVQT